MERFKTQFLLSDIVRIDHFRGFESYWEIPAKSETAINGTWKAGKTTVGLKEEAVGWALDENNRKLITPEMESKINAAKADIISGKIQVADYRDNNSCPAK